MSKTWLLFDNGNYYSVNATIYKANFQSSRPADAFVVSENHGDFTIAAKNAVHAAYNCLSQCGFKVLPNTAGLELTQRTDAGENIAGESGGLSFAIAYAKSLMDLQFTDVAATGVVMADGTIGKVGGIEKKLSTAAELVCQNGFVFYPKANQVVLDQNLDSMLKSKQIQCHAVDHIDDVFDVLVPGKKKKKIKKRLILLAVFIALFIAGYMVFSGQDDPSDLKKNVISDPVKEKQIESPLQPPVKKETIPVDKPKEDVAPVKKAEPENPEPKKEKVLIKKEKPVQPTKPVSKDVQKDSQGFD